jgi:SAM-dependent methyltransferase
MDPKALEPYGAALNAFFAGDTAATLTICRDDGRRVQLPVGHFFRPRSAFSPIEETAIARCRGHVLDVGAGTGLHSLVLQQKGLHVTAIDISPDAAEIMVRRGVEDVRCVALDQFRGGPFDTILMMGHGVGMVETLAGLRGLLSQARRLVTETGQVLFDSLDVCINADPENQGYLNANRSAGRYNGEVRLRFEYQGLKGPQCGWLHVDTETLKEHAAKEGWDCEVVLAMPSGDYLARLITMAS